MGKLQGGDQRERRKERAPSLGLFLHFHFFCSAGQSRLAPLYRQMSMERLRHQPACCCPGNPQSLPSSEREKGNRSVECCPGELGPALDQMSGPPTILWVGHPSPSAFTHTGPFLWTTVPPPIQIQLLLLGHPKSSPSRKFLPGSGYPILPPLYCRRPPCVSHGPECR